MPDWSKLVHDHLGGLGLQASERAEIVEELAGHLEEIFRSCGGKGSRKKTPRVDASGG